MTVSRRSGRARAHSLAISLIALASLALRPGVALAQPAMPAPVKPDANIIQPGPPVKDVGFDQRLGESIPLDATFRDENGRSVALRDYMGKKPVLLSLVYYGCPMICGLATEGLVRSLKALKWNVGAEFDVLVVSFDAREGPEQAAERRNGSLKAYDRPGAESGWHFLTGSEESIRRLTRSVGFRYVWDDEAKQFAHATGVVALTPEGRIARYFFGVEYSPKDLRFGLMEASEKRIGGVVDQLLLLCYHYDPKMGRYTPALLKLLKVSAAFTLLVLGGAIWWMLRAEKPRAARPPERRAA